MILCVPTLRASSDALLFICFLFFWLAASRQQRGPAARYKRQVIRYKRQALHSSLVCRRACRLSRVFSREIVLDMGPYLWDYTYIMSKTIGGKNDR